MRCLYYDGTECYATPAVITPKYKPEQDVMEKYCSKDGFKACPRFTSYQPPNDQAAGGGGKGPGTGK